jgi:hypothetical protein
VRAAAGGVRHRGVDPSMSEFDNSWPGTVLGAGGLKLHYLGITKIKTPKSKK